jgi:hypothetical protein
VFEVSRSGFYDYQARQATPKIDAEEVVLLVRVKAIAAAARFSYGNRRMAKALQAEGFAVGRVKVRRLMKEAGVQVKRAKRRGPVTTDSRHGYEVAPNLLARQFDVDEPDYAWVGDITYVWTAEGWLYVSTLLDFQVHQAHRFQLAIAGRMEPEDLHRLGDDAADGHARVERSIRILKDHLQLAAVRQHGPPREMVDAAAIERHFALHHARIEQADNRPGRRRLAAARFADQAERFAGANVKADAIDGPNHARRTEQPAAKRKMDLQIAHRKQRFVWS